MMKTKRILAITAVAVVAAQTSFAQTAPTAPMTPAPTPAPINLDFLSTLFGSSTPPTEESIRSAFSTAGLNVERYRTSGDGEIRVRATTTDGQEVRVRIDDGEVRYSLRSNGDSTDDNNGPMSRDGVDTSDDNGASSDSNGSDTSDRNGGKSRGGNGGNSGGGNGGNSGGGNGGNS